MNTLFGKNHINNLQLPNRFVRSATWEGMATKEGAVTPKLIETIGHLALGGVGLIISSHAYIEKRGQASVLQLGAYEDELLPGLRVMVTEAHRHGGKFILQLAHGGTRALTRFSGEAPLAVSLLDEKDRKEKKEIDTSGIQNLISAFVDGAERAQKAGFDGVQIHAAHGYLLSQFLSPIFNKRTDEYGGAVENRTRILVEIVRAIRETTGPDYPLLIKMNGNDYYEGGLTTEEAVESGMLLENAGLDAIEISGGLPISGKLVPTRVGIDEVEKEAYFLDVAKQFKEKIRIPIILVGGFRSFEMADKVIRSGAADYVSMCRPFIREPGIVKRWESGDLRPSACKSDNQCFRPGMKGTGIYCVTKETENEPI